MKDKKIEGLSNQIVGKLVVPVPGLEHIWKLEKNLSGEYFGTVQAAWVQEGAVKFLVSGPMGDMMEVFATHVKVRF